MKSRLPMEYLKIMTFNRKLEVFKKYDESFLSASMLEDEIPKYFWALKSLLVFYCKYIRYIYKTRGIFLYTPVEILIQAGKDGTIADSEVWLEYTKWVNHCLCIEDAEQRKNTMLEVMKRFRLDAEKMLVFMHSDENTKLMKDNDELFQKISQTRSPLADNKPIYSCEELGITEHSYNILLDFFKSYPEIRGVWLHGSRAYGTSDAGSDLDLLLDCEVSAWENVRKEFAELLVPYYIDGKNLRIEETAEYVNSIIPYGTKKIYDSADFQIYWDDKKPCNNTSIKVDIGKVLF